VSAAAFKERLRADLKTALRERAMDEVRVLRTLIATLDNAEAVPGEYVALPRAFGDPSGEGARQELDAHAVAALLESEIDSRLAAAEDYQDRRRADEAARLRHEAQLLHTYRA